MNKVQNHWNESSDEYYKKEYDSGETLAAITNVPEWAFPEAVFPLIKKYCPDLRDKRVCVPSSGDNVAVFGFYLLGAHVTSVDMSELKFLMQSGSQRQRAGILHLFLITAWS